MSGRRRLVRVAAACLAAPLAVMPAGAGLADDLLADGHVIVRARVEPATVYVGQPASLEISVLTRTWFLKAPRYPDTVAAGDAIVVPPEAFGLNFTEQIDGETYAGQTRSFTIFPTRPGTVAVPAVPVTLAVADADGARTPDFTLHTDALELKAAVPAAAAGLGLVVAAPSVGVRQTWDPAPEGLAAGDGVRRTVTMEIEDSVAMLLPAIEFRGPDGVAVYPERTAFDDSRARGAMLGTRIESATLVFERAGTFTLPEIEVRWWDLDAEALRTETLDAVTVEVAEADAGALPAFDEPDGTEADAEPTPPARRIPWRGLLAALAAAAVVVWAGRVAARRLLRRRRERRPRLPDEAELFARLRRAARGDAPAGTLAACYAWLPAARPGSTTTLAGLAAEADDPTLADDLRALGAAAVGIGNGPDRARLVRGLSALRRRRVATHRARGDRLCPLNPRSAS